MKTILLLTTFTLTFTTLTDRTSAGEFYRIKWPTSHENTVRTHGWNPCVVSFLMREAVRGAFPFHSSNVPVEVSSIHEAEQGNSLDLKIRFRTTDSFAHRHYGTISIYEDGRVQTAGSHAWHR